MSASGKPISRQWGWWIFGVPYLIVSVSIVVLVWVGLVDLPNQLYNVFNRSAEDVVRSTDLTTYYMNDVRKFLKEPERPAPEELIQSLRILRSRREIILSSSRVDHLEPAFLAFVTQQVDVFDRTVTDLLTLLESAPLTPEEALDTESLSFVAEDTMTYLFLRNDAYVKKKANKTKEWIFTLSIAIVILISLLLFLFGMVTVLWRRTQKQRTVMRNQALHDSLTGLYNRRYFDEVSGPLVESALRSGTSLCLLMIDVDHFKKYNDTYGHDCGDVALVRVAATLRETAARKGDLVFRMGGEEFCCLVTTQDVRGAVHVAERVRAAVERRAIPHATSPVSTCLTVSVGVACLNPPGIACLEHLYVAADKAMYEAKGAGRNTVHVCGTAGHGGTARLGSEGAAARLGA